MSVTQQPLRRDTSLDQAKGGQGGQIRLEAACLVNQFHQLHAVAGHEPQCHVVSPNGLDATGNVKAAAANNRPRVRGRQDRRTPRHAGHDGLYPK